MPLSTDNQAFGASDKNSNSKKESAATSKDKKSEDNKLTSDDLKGKKVDADPSKESDKPADT